MQTITRKYNTTETSSVFVKFATKYGNGTSLKYDVSLMKKINVIQNAEVELESHAIHIASCVK